MSITNELVTNFEFNGNLNKITEYNTSFGSAISLMTKSIGIATTLSGAFLGLANSTLTTVDRLGQLSRNTNTSVEYLQKMGYVASVNGGSVEALEDSVRGLSERIGEYASMDSGEGKAIFEKLGIAVRNANGEVKTAEVVMDELRGKFQTMSKTEQVSIAQKLGINQGMLQTLNLTNEELEKNIAITEAFGVVTSKQTDEVIKYNDSITTLKFGMSAIGQQISLSFLPQMNNLTRGFNDVLVANKDLIKNGLTTFVDITGEIIEAVMNTGKAFYNIIDETIGFENAIMLAGGAVLWFNRALLRNPIGLVVAAAAGLILIVDDLYTAFTGGESVIKDFFATFNIDIVKTLTGAFNILKGTWNGLIAVALQLSESVMSLFTILEKGGKFVGLDFGLGIEEQYLKIKGLKEEYQKLSKEQMNSAIDGGIKIDNTKEIGTSLDMNNPANFNDKGVVRDAPVPANINNNVVNNVNVDVKANNTEMTQQAIEKAIDNSLKSANEQFASKGR